MGSFSPGPREVTPGFLLSMWAVAVAGCRKGEVPGSEKITHLVLTNSCCVLGSWKNIKNVHFLLGSCSDEQEK